MTVATLPLLIVALIVIMVVMLVVGGSAKNGKKEVGRDTHHPLPTCYCPLSTLLVSALPIHHHCGHCCHYCCCHHIDGGGGTGLGVVVVG